MVSHPIREFYAAVECSINTKMHIGHIVFLSVLIIRAADRIYSTHGKITYGDPMMSLFSSNKKTKAVRQYSKVLGIPLDWALIGLH